MGIRHLNRFLKENASNTIKLCRLAEFSGKKISVDISIYMYRFASDNSLIENIYLMLSIFSARDDPVNKFKHMKICPNIFFFIYDS